MKHTPFQAVYGDHFPLEARHALSGWLETTFIPSAAASASEGGGAGGDDEHQQQDETARTLGVALIQRLEAKAAAEGADFALKAKLGQIADGFKVGPVHK